MGLPLLEQISSSSSLSLQHPSQDSQLKAHPRTGLCKDRNLGTSHLVPTLALLTSALLAIPKKKQKNKKLKHPFVFVEGRLWYGPFYAKLSFSVCLCGSESISRNEAKYFNSKVSALIKDYQTTTKRGISIMNTKGCENLTSGCQIAVTKPSIG